MGVIPTCVRLVTALTKETAYGTGIADGSLDKMFHIINPDLPEITLDTIDDQAFIRGHEFLDDNTAFKILFQNVTFSLTGVPLSAEFLGWLLAAAMGNITSAQIMTSGDYDHTAKIQDKCTSDQLPSRTLGLLYAGSLSVSKKYTGCVIDSWTIRITEKGFVTCDVSFITDGKELDGSAITVPTAFHSENFYFGVDNTLKYADFEASLVDNSAKFAGMEITYNNNHLVEEAKNRSLKTQTSLTELRMGDRTIEVSLTLYIDETDQAYIDALAATRKVIELTVTGPTLSGGNDSDMVITIPQARWIPAGRTFDGTKRTISFNHMLYNDSTEGTPLKIKTTTRDVVYI